MGKRSKFKRIERDFYPTPFHALEPLLFHLPKTKFTFIEPCAGNGALKTLIEENTNGKCEYACDIKPMRNDIKKEDALFINNKLTANYIITNPPWNRKILHPMIDHFRTIAPTWLLFDADWMHTIQSIPYMKYCIAIVSVGRVKWFPTSKSVGKDNCAWYLFGKNQSATRFFGRFKNEK